MRVRSFGRGLWPGAHRRGGVLYFIRCWFLAGCGRFSQGTGLAGVPGLRPPQISSRLV